MKGYKPIKDAPKPHKFNKEDVLRELNDRLSRQLPVWLDIYDRAFRDVAFIAGEQWDPEALEERQREGRPALTLNKLPQFVERVVGEFRKKSFSLRIRATDYSKDYKISNLDKSKIYSQAQVLEAIIKQIEKNSNAYYHYKWAFKQAVEGGIGWLRVITDYVSDDTFSLDIKIRSVKNRSSVIIDLSGEEPDLSDAKWALIYTRMDKDEFRRKFPDANTNEASWLSKARQFWYYDNKVTLAEYFLRYPVRRTLVLFNDGTVAYKDEIEDVINELYQNEGKIIVAEREVTSWKVHWFLTNGTDILDDTEWPGSIIPIIPIFGRTHTTEGNTYFKSLVSDAIDSQKVHNYFMTSAVEKVALVPKAPFVGPADAFEGYEEIWANANRKNYSYLPYNPLASQPPQRAQNVSMSSEELRLSLTGNEEIRETIGIYDSLLGASNEVSGKVLAAKIAQNSPIIYEFFDNFKLALTKLGKILIEVIPRIYTEERQILIERGNKKDIVYINQTVLDEETGEEIIINNLRLGKYDVTVTMDNAYDTPSEEFIDKFISIAQYMPSIAQVAPDLLIKAMQIPGGEEIAERLEKTLPPEFLNDEERKEVLIDKAKAQIETMQLMQQLGLNRPTPAQQMALAEQQLKLQKKQMEIEGKKIDVTKKAMEAQKTQAIAQKEMSETLLTAEGIKNLVVQTIMDILPHILTNSQDLSKMINENKEEGGNNE